MANYQTWIELTLTDANGNQAKMVIPNGLNPDTVTMATLAGQVTSLLTALGAPGTITNAKVTSATVRFLYEKATPSAGAVDAEYSGVEDKARLNFLNSSSGRGILSIPAPVSAVFAGIPNEDTVDPAGPVAPLIAWYEAHAGNPTGLLNVYNGGVKASRHAPRRSQHRVG